MNSFSNLIKDDNHIYYNISIFPNTNFNHPESFVAKFTESRSDPILDRPEDYHLSIVRFSIPGESIPIFVYPTTPILNGQGKPTGQYQVNNNVYSVTLSYFNGVTTLYYQEFLAYVSNFTYLASTNLRFYYVYSYQQFIDMINTAFSNAFISLKTANPSVKSTRAPYLLFNPVTKLISLIYQQTIITDGILIYFNTALSLFFDNYNFSFLPLNAPNGTHARFLLENTLSNTYSESPINLVINTTSGSPIITSSGNLFTLYNDGATVSALGIPENTIATYNSPSQMTLSQNATATASPNAIFTVSNLFITTQEFNSLFLWNSLKSIVITSSSIPVTNEFLPSIPFNDNGISQGSIFVATQNQFRKIVSDFEPQIVEGTDSRSTIQYLPTAEYRRIDLKGKTPLTTFDVQIYWVDQNGLFYPLYLIPFSNSISIKFLFEKKSKYYLK